MQDDADDFDPSLKVGPHHIRCQVCGTVIDMRRLGEMLEHEDVCRPALPPLFPEAS